MIRLETKIRRLPRQLLRMTKTLHRRQAAPIQLVRTRTSRRHRPQIQLLLAPISILLHLRGHRQQTQLQKVRTLLLTPKPLHRQQQTRRQLGQTTPLRPQNRQRTRRTALTYHQMVLTGALTTTTEMKVTQAAQIYQQLLVQMGRMTQLPHLTPIPRKLIRSRAQIH